MYRFDLSEDELIIQKLAKKFVDKEIKTVALEFEKDEEGKLTEAVFKKAAKVGILGSPTPKEYGGSEASSVERSILLEELAVSCAGIASSICASWLGQTLIILGGTKEQQQKWLPALTQDGNLCCVAFTEPAGGSDIENPNMHFKTVKTSIKNKENNYTINGTKMWPSNSGNAYLYLVALTTDRELGDEGSCIFMVPDGTPGLSFGKPIKKMGMEPNRHSEIFFDNVKVSEGNLLGKIGDGSRLLQRGFVYSRTEAGAISTGIARGAFEIALSYAKERVVANKPLIEHQLISAMFADMAIQINAARLLYLKAAYLNAQQRSDAMIWSTMAKVIASDMAVKVASDCIQAMGSFGYSKEVGVEKYFRDAKIMQICFGPNELLRQLIGENL